MSDRTPVRIEYKPETVVQKSLETGMKEEPTNSGNSLRKKLTDVCPEIVDYWDYERNPKRPEEYSASSSEKVYTFCPECGKSLYRSVRFSRRDAKAGIVSTVIPCKKCSKHDDEKTLASMCPEITQYWIRERNGYVTPDMVMAHSAEQVYVRCPNCDKELLRPAYSCTRRDSMGRVYIPVCNDCQPLLRTDRLLQSGKTLRDVCTDIELYWSDENGDKRPEDYTKASKQQVYLNCPGCGKVLCRTVFNSVKRNDDGSYSVILCQRCGAIAKQNAVLKEQGLSVADICPSAIDWWDYEKNGSITPEQVYAGSNYEYYFKCPRCELSRLSTPHKFINRRANGDIVPQDCPECGFSEKEIVPISSICPEIKEWWNYKKNAPRVPEDFSRGSTFPAYLTCPTCGIELRSFIRDAVTIYPDGTATMTHQGKCAFLRTLANEYNLVKLFPTIVDYWDYERNALPPERYTIHSNDSAYFKCPDCGHVKYKRISDSCRENVDGSIPFMKCKFCELERIRPISFGALYPELAAELQDDIDPFSILPSKYLYAEWKCSECGMRWNAHVHDRVLGERPCPYCSGFIPIPGKTSFAAICPELATECIDQNVDLDRIFPSYSIPIRWKCGTCNQEWNASPQRRVSGEATCPYCDGRKAIPGKTSFKALYTDLMDEWLLIENTMIGLDPDRILPSYDGEAWWICHLCKCKYTLKVKDRVLKEKRGHNPCPECNGRRQKKTYFV